MKSILLLAISAFVINFSFAQDWSIINPNRTVFFQHSDSAYISNTIVVDSTNILGMDSTFYTGYAFKYCDTCQGFSLAQPIIYRYAKELLGFSITHSSSHQNYILDEDTIYHHAQLSDSWDFNASQTASVVAVGETSILGVTDSIKTIELSTNDTIILSKNYGVIRYPDFENTGAYYEMVGYHEGQNSFGDYLPNFWRTYDFNVGDLFCYVVNKYYLCYNYFYEASVRILQDQSIGNIKQFLVQTIYTFNSSASEPDCLQDSYVLNSIHVINIENDKNRYENINGVAKVNTNCLAMNNLSPIMQYNYNDFQSYMYSTYLNDSLFGLTKKIHHLSLYGDSLLKLAPTSHYKYFASNVGMTLLEQAPTLNEIIESRLVGTIINGDTTGTIFNYPDDLGLKTVEPSKALNVYPNPTHDNIYLPQTFKTVSVFTTLGQKVLEVKTGDTILDVSTLPKGLYLIQAVDQNGMVYQSKIIKN
ncbi:MAG: T9SS type A sorting domain-containing protein [Putridiphycobacter sp.]